MSDVKVEPTPTAPGPVYLGGAVYASSDGYLIWLHLNDHRSPALIALEPDVFDALELYAKRVWGERI